MEILEKFNLSKKLSNKISKIRKDVQYKISTEKDAKLEKWIIIYMIDKLGIRIGHENERGTFGCCTLTKKHVKFLNNKEIKLTFLGKHNILYDKVVNLDPKVIVYLKKQKGRLFPNTDPSMVNRVLNKYISGLTAKVFRTYNVNHKLQLLLAKKPIDVKPKKWLIHANKQIALFCNHTSRSTSKENYIDPRIIQEYTNKHGLTLKDFYSDEQLKKFSNILNIAK